MEWTSKMRYSTFSIVASIWREGTTDDTLVKSGWIGSEISTSAFTNIRIFLVHVYYREINWTNNSLTIICLLDWGINSLSVGGNKTTFNIDRIIERTIRLPILHKCFVRKYLAQQEVRWWTEWKKLKKNSPVSIEDETHIFCCCGSIGYFNRDRLLSWNSRWEFSWCWVERQGWQFRTQSRLEWSAR